MNSARTRSWRALRSAVASILCVGAAVLVLDAPAASATPTTAWQSGAFHVNVAGVVGESDVVLGAPNAATSEFLPLGNGSLGVAEWAANGFTAQLNRDDTFPDRKSPGQLNIPGLTQMTTASNFTGTLDLYNGMLNESGGGMTLKAWVPAGKDELIVDVTGANPSQLQTATVSLWSGRSPTAAASSGIGTLAETWTDNTEPGYSGNTYGSLAAITAGGQSVTASVVNSKEVDVSFYPNSDGSYRVIVGAPGWSGGNAATTASTLFGSDATASASSLLSTQSSWWNSYWADSNLMQITSSDGSGEYMENLRTLYLYFEAALMRGSYPGSQAGIADLFSFSQDSMLWVPSDYWLYDLRTQISENMSSGNFALNIPIFDLYLNNLSNLESWTTAQMGGTSGICVPETMRFNGNGYYSSDPGYVNASCSQNAPGQGSPGSGDPGTGNLYNALDVTSGAELAMDIWQQYEDTGDTAFLSTYYPLMKQAAIFLLDYQTLGSDGYLHADANAHESQWNVLDPTDDIAAETALFPATIAAAQTLGVDSSLQASLTTAQTEIPPYARTDEATHTQLLTASSDAGGTDVIGDSYDPTAPLYNEENIGLEPVYPYGVIGDDSPLAALADRTYTYRPNGPTTADWSMDAIDAARLDMASEVKSDLITNAERMQMFISGMADVVGHTNLQPYVEQSSGVGYALDQALVQDYDGLLRIAPAWPSGWDVSGTVAIQGNAKVDVQVESGTIETVAIEAGSSQTIDIRNPWPGQSVEVVNGSTNSVVVSPTTASTFTIPVSGGSTYLVEQTSNLTTSLTYAQVTGSTATTDRHLGGVQIGLDSAGSLASTFNNVGITNDSSTNSGNYDGNGSSFSEQALTSAGASPGAQITSGGLTYTWPNVAAGTPDNATANGQVVNINKTGSELGFLYASSNGTGGDQIVPGSITYTDGTTQQYTFVHNYTTGTNASPRDWFSSTAPDGGLVALSTSYINIQGNAQATQAAHVFSETVPIDPTKTVAYITLPSVETFSTSTQPWHIFAVTVGSPNLAASFDDIAITNDSSTNVGNYDGNGSSFSETALTTAGASPGASITSGGLTYTFPNVSAGTVDNTVADGQEIGVGQAGSELGFLLSASYGPASGSGVITYTDGTTQSYTLTSPDWWSTTPPSGGAVAASGTYLNVQGNSQYTHSTDVFSEQVTINPDKTVASITLPPIGTLASGTATMHIFAVSVGSPNLAASFDDVGITNDTSTNVGNYDGNGSSFSEAALTTAGASPGASITSGGLTYTWPNVSAGTEDNTVADGQAITIGASGSHIGFLLSASYGPASGSGVITYTDGTTQSYTLTSPDWWSTTPPSGGAVAVSGSYLNIQGNSQYTHSTDVFSEQVSINSSKTVASITLPDVGTLASASATMHIFAVKVA